MDVCGNTTIHFQTISVEDIEVPTFTQPADLTVNCENVNNLLIAGDVTNHMDNCDGDPDVSFVDNITVPGSCPFNYTMERTWTVTDACGNSTSKVQTIFVQDISDPVFTTVPQDETIICTDDSNADAAFMTWVANYGGGVASDNCGTITWYALEPGTYNINDPLTFVTPPTGLNGATCPSPIQGVCP